MRKAIIDGLEPTECRWVYDTSPATFCCEPVIPTKSYCPEHAKIVYIKPAIPRARRPFLLPVDTIAPPKADETEQHPTDVMDVLNPGG